MKTIPAGLQADLDSLGTTVCTCWKITRRDAVVMGFTDLIRDITVDSVLYKAATGFARTAIANNATFAVDNVDIEGAVRDDGITADDIRAGLYDRAEVLVTTVNYRNVGNGFAILRYGFIGEIALRDGIFVCELRGLTQAYTKTIVRVFTFDCWARVGDSECQVNLAPFTDTGEIATILVQRRHWTSQIFAPVNRNAGFYDLGILTFNTGLNAGLSFDVKKFDVPSTGNIELWLPTPYDIAVGDEFTVVAGCDGLGSTCRTKFNNYINYRGFERMPGFDRAIQYPDAKAR